MVRLALIGGVALALAASASAQDLLGNEVLRRLNEARAAAGAPPLAWNDQLAAAALAHSADMAAQEMVSHVGSDGSQFWERAGRAGYPMVTGAQNVLARADLSARNVVDQWQLNAANNQNLLNPDYQEVGFAVVESSAGTYFYTLLLGRRQGFATPTPTQTPAPTLTPFTPPVVTITPTASLTPLPSPTRDPIILTLLAPMPTATLDVRLSVTPPPRPTLAVLPTQPPAVDLRLYLSFDSVTVQSAGRTPVDLTGIEFVSERARLAAVRFDNGFLTAPIDALPPQDCVQVWGSEVEGVLPRQPQCAQRHGWLVVGEAAAFWRGVERFQVLRGGVPVAECIVSETPSTCDVSFAAAGAVRPLPTATPPSSVVVSAGVVRLLIGDDGVTLHNMTGSSLDVSGYVFEGPGVFRASTWNTPELTRPLDAIPTGDCLQVWASGAINLPKPDTCRYRHGWVIVGEPRRFWGEGAFTVRDGDRTLVTCAAGAAVCEFRP